MTIYDISREIQERAEKVQELQGQIEKKRAAAENAQRQATAAAEAGDLPDYKAKKNFVHEVQDEIEFLQTQIDRLQRTRPERDSVLSAWRDYAQKHNTAYKKRMAEYEKLKAQLLACYGSMVDAQKEAIASRSKCAGFIGCSESEAETLFPFDAMPCGNSLADITANRYIKAVNNIDLEYFIAAFIEKRGLAGAGLINDEALNSIMTAVNRK